MFKFIKRDWQMGLVNEQTKEEIFPPCIEDLKSFCDYTRGRYGEVAEQNVLSYVFKGGKPISEMHHLFTLPPRAPGRSTKMASPVAHSYEEEVSVGMRM